MASKTSRARVIECERCGTSFTRPQGSHTRLCSTLCRFMTKVRPSTSSCWEWTGANDGRGYGHLGVAGQTIKAYRWAFVHIGGGQLIPGLQLDHLCRNRRCVNPAHLEQVTPKVNSNRGEANSSRTARTGVCQRGHSMEDAYVVPATGFKQCRTCNRERQRQSRNRKAAS